MFLKTVKYNFFDDRVISYSSRGAKKRRIEMLLSFNCKSLSEIRKIYIIDRFHKSFELYDILPKF